MSKGRCTTGFFIRISDEIVEWLKKKKNMDETEGGYIKRMIYKAYQTDITNPKNTEEKVIGGVHYRVQNKRTFW